MRGTGNLQGESRGTFIHATILQSFLKAHPDKVVALLDIENTFNSVRHSAIRAALREDENLRFALPVFQSQYGWGNSVYFPVLERSIPLTNGVIQGSVFSPFFFVLAISRLLRETLAGGAVKSSSYADDYGLYGCPVEVPSVVGNMRPALAKGNLNLKASKTLYLVGHGVSEPAREELAQSLVDACDDGSLTLEAARASVVEGAVVAGVPIGTDTVKRAELDKLLTRMENITGGLNDLVELP